MTMRAKPDGFELRFTAPVDAEDGRRSGKLFAGDFHASLLRALTAARRSSRPTSASSRRRPAPDGLSVRLVVDKLVRGHIHELHFPGLRDRAGQPLLHDVAYYTLNEIPKP